MHRALHGRLVRDHRHGRLPPDRRERPDRERLRRRRRRLGIGPDLHRGRRRPHLGDPRRHRRHGPHRLLDGPRPITAPGHRQGAPHVGHALPDHGQRHRPGRGPRRARAAGHAGQPRQHRHAVRVHHRLDRRADPAPHPAGPAAALPGALLPRHPRPVGARLPLPDDQPVDRDLAALRRLDAAGRHALLRLRAAQRPSRPPRQRPYRLT